MTFTFTMDAFPGYTYFNPTRKVLCAIQIVEDAIAGNTNAIGIFPHEEGEEISESGTDSVSEEKSVTKISEDILTVIPQSETVKEKAVSELIGEDVYVSSNGLVQGTLKEVTDFTGFSDEADEQAGYFLPIRLTNKGTKMTILKNGKIEDFNVDFESDVVLRIDNVNTTYEIKVDGETVVVINFAQAVLE